jgi:hypothetical protein
MYALIQGALTQARILDDLEMVRDARLGVFDLLGIGEDAGARNASRPEKMPILKPSELASASV